MDKKNKEDKMKASDYADKFRAKGCTIDALLEIVSAMIVEVRDIGFARKIRTDEGLFPILDEMDLKFESFFRQVGGELYDGSFIRKTAFKRMLQNKMPDVFDAWNMHKGGRLMAD
jgi:hypothetical protein